MFEKLFFIFTISIIAKYIKIKNMNNYIFDFGHNLSLYIFLQISSITIPIIIYYYFQFSLYLLLLMHILRIPAYRLTILPPLNNIEYQKYNEKLFGLCGGNRDYIWSGHSSTVAFASCIYILNNTNLIYKILLLFYNICLGILIIGTRNHYSVDVYVGWIIGSLFGYINQKC